jgi:hypothetical protein
MDMAANVTTTATLKERMSDTSKQTRHAAATNDHRVPRQQSAPTALAL